MSEDDQTEDPVALEFKLQDGSELRFHTNQDIADFIARERQFWDWLDQAHNTRKSVGIDGNEQNTIASIHAIIIRHLTNADSYIQQNNIANCENALGEIYQKHATPISNSPACKYLQGLSSSDPIIAAMATGYFLGNGVNLQNMTPKVLKALFGAHIFSEGLSPNTNHHVAALDDAHAQLLQKINESQTNLQTFKSDSLELLDKRRVELDQLKTSKQTEIDDVLNKTIEELEEITKTYDEKLSLQAPVSYWVAAQKSHFKASLGFGATALLSAVGGGLFLFWFANMLFFQGMLMLAEKIAATEIHSSPAEVALFIVISTFIVWIIRIFVRLFLSELHLMSVSKERVVMANTYLSLARSGDGIAENDKQLILGVLFRPATTGLVKEDGVPPGVYDLLTKVGKN